MRGIKAGLQIGQCCASHAHAAEFNRDTRKVTRRWRAG
jgi:hypothetical protein